MQRPDNVISLVPSSTSVVIRTSANTPGVINSVREASDHLSKEEVVTGFATVHAIIQSSLASRRFAVMLLGSFAVLALVLAAIGLYGVMAYAVGRRTHEIGIRMALGAERGAILKMVVAKGLKLALLGVTPGVIGALGLTRLLSGLLYGVKPTDPVTLIVVSCVLTLVGLVASYIPARRAAKVDPVVALRHE